MTAIIRGRRRKCHGPRVPMEQLYFMRPPLAPVPQLPGGRNLRGHNRRRSPSCSRHLRSTGVEIAERGYVRVDEWMRTGEAGVFAVGDLVATPQLAHVGFAEAILAVKQILGERAFPVDYGKVPWAIYCHPEVAFVGMTEQDALDAGIETVTKRDPFGGNSRARILGETDGLVKVICEKTPDGGAGRLLGVHMAGPWVTEQLGQAYLSVNWEAKPEIGTAS